MNLYLVYMPGGGSRIEPKFPRRYQLADGLWAVASRAATCADVCGEIGIGDGTRGVVSTMDSYYGYFDNALWQKLAAWSAEE